MSKNGTQIHLRTKTQKNETLPKGIANRHLKVLDKCNIAINGKWLKDYLFLNLTKDKRPSAQNIKNPIECKGKKNIVQVKK